MRDFRVAETDFEPGPSGWSHNEPRQKVEEPLQPFPAQWVEAHGTTETRFVTAVAVL